MQFSKKTVQATFLLSSITTIFLALNGNTGDSFTIIDQKNKAISFPLEAAKYFPDFTRQSPLVAGRRLSLIPYSYNRKEKINENEILNFNEMTYEDLERTKSLIIDQKGKLNEEMKMWNELTNMKIEKLLEILISLYKVNFSSVAIVGFIEKKLTKKIQDLVKQNRNEAIKIVTSPTFKIFAKQYPFTAINISEQF